MTKCLHCGKNLKINGNYIKLFCNNTCRSRYNAKKRYNLIKNTQKFKEYRRKYFQRWLSNPKNRKHFNELLREKNRLYQEKRRKKRKAEGLCTRCGVNKVIKGYNCEKCKKKWRNEYYKKIL